MPEINKITYRASRIHNETLKFSIEYFFNYNYHRETGVRDLHGPIFQTRDRPGPNSFLFC